MTDGVFTDTEDTLNEADDVLAETPERWVDVRVTDPDAGEWDIGVVVGGGRVEFVDLRIDPTLLAGFIDCLVDDVPEARAAEILTAAAERRGIDPVAFSDSYSSH